MGIAAWSVRALRWLWSGCLPGKGALLGECPLSLGLSGSWEHQTYRGQSVPRHQNIGIKDKLNKLPWFPGIPHHLAPTNRPPGSEEWTPPSSAAGKPLPQTPFCGVPGALSPHGSPAPACALRAPPEHPSSLHTVLPT